MKKWQTALCAVVTVAGILVVGSTFFSVSNAAGSDTLVINMAHNQAGGSEIAGSIAKIAEFVAEDPSQQLAVNIYDSGVLGSEKEEIELVKAGVLDMAKVGAQTLSQFEDKYSVFALPYLFQSQEHYYEACENSEKIKELFTSTADDGYIAIGYYANGSRNFYLKENIAVTDPSVLKGKKIRSMQSTTSMDMIEKMGGSPVPMASGETYSALQQGIVDGAENTELVLTVDGHQDLVKAYTYTEHQYSPDIYIISTKTWNRLTDGQKELLTTAIQKANDNFKNLYNGMMLEATQEAEQHGVTIYRDIDKTAFIEAVQPIHADYTAKGDDYKALYDDIQKYAQ
ncbi:MAG: TRAP transporter substrate-binding protein DctP [Clostridiales bacterium]|nr:TRAP transporter substrate-binding protein DctP [Clostridiales bacterium]